MAGEIERTRIGASAPIGANPIRSKTTAGSPRNFGELNGMLWKAQEHLYPKTGEIAFTDRADKPESKSTPFKKATIYMGALTKSEPPDEELKKLIENTSVLVVAASSKFVTADGINRAKDIAKKMEKDNFKVQGYISSSGVPRNAAAQDPLNPKSMNDLGEQEIEFCRFLKENHTKLDYINEDGSINKEKRNKIFAKELQGDSIMYALRVDESNPEIHKAWSEFLRQQISASYKKGIDGISIDDADNRYLEQREKSTNIEGKKRYERGMNNHIRTIADMTDCAKSCREDSVITINRGYDIGKGLDQNQWHVGLNPDNYQWSDQYKAFCSSADPETRQAIQRIYKNTDSVIFESINSDTDIKLFAEYLINLHGANPNIQIQWVAYKDDLKAQDMNEAIDKTKANFSKLMAQITDPSVKKWAEEHVHIKVYPQQVLTTVDASSSGRVAEL